MRREDVQPLLYKAVDGLPEPDLADVAWAAAVDTRRRRRRGVLIGLLLALVIAVIAAIGAGVSGSNKADLVPPPTPSLPPGYVPPAGQIAGIDYWVAPPSGSERFLDRLETPLGDQLRLPDNPPPLVQHTLAHLAAVVLQHFGGLYEPLLLGADSSWAVADVDLHPIRTGAPLSPGTVSPDGRIAAFPQPGELVTVDATTAQITRYDLPTEDIRSVSWLGDAERVLVSGPGVAYRVLVGQGRFGEGTLVKISGAPDPEAVTAPFTLDSGAVMRYMTNGEWVVDSALQLPVRSWVGQTFSTNSTAARVFIANDLPQFPRATSQPQVLAAISTLRAVPSHLLVLTDSPRFSTSSPPPAPADRAYVREPGCCAVLGWYDDYTPLLQVRGWVLAWDLRSGQVRRLTELAVNGVALGPGIRP